MQACGFNVIKFDFNLDDMNVAKKCCSTSMTCKVSPTQQSPASQVILLGKIQSIKPIYEDCSKREYQKVIQRHLSHGIIRFLRQHCYTVIRVPWEDRIDSFFNHVERPDGGRNGDKAPSADGKDPDAIDTVGFN